MQLDLAYSAQWHRNKNTSDQITFHSMQLVKTMSDLNRWILFTSLHFVCKEVTVQKQKQPALFQAWVIGWTMIIYIEFLNYLAIYNVHFVNIMYFISMMNNNFKAFINLG